VPVDPRPRAVQQALRQLVALQDIPAEGMGVHKIVSGPNREERESNRAPSFLHLFNWHRQRRSDLQRKGFGRYATHPRNRESNLPTGVLGEVEGLG
jgi:hypothetical protein